MKRIYMSPEIMLQLIDAEDFLDESLPIFNEENPNTESSDVITSGDEVLGNKNSVWDE